MNAAIPTHDGDDRAGGFTLVEILAVLAILGLLMSLSIYYFGRQTERARAVQTQATISELATLITAYQTKFGDWPPDRLSALKIRTQANDTNEGAESLYAALHNISYPEGNNVTEKWLGNTDDDDTSTKYNRNKEISKLLEVLDGWHNPIAYIRNDDYGDNKEFAYVMGDPEDPNDPNHEQNVKAQKNPVTGAYANADGYQLISAGADHIFGTQDDVKNF